MAPMFTSLLEFNKTKSSCIRLHYYTLHVIQFDPNGRQCLTMDGYREIGRIVQGLATRHSDGRLLIVQEGGYHVTYSAYCLHATLEGVLNLPLPLLQDPVACYLEDETFPVKVIEAIKNYIKDKMPLWKTA